MGATYPDIKKLKADGDAAGLVKAMRHENSCARDDAASALAEIGGESAVSPIYKAFKGGSITRKCAIASLTRIGGAQAAARVTDMIIATDWDQRKEIARELKEIGLQSVISGVFWYYICNSETIQLSEDYRKAARGAVDAVLSCLRSPDRQLRWDAFVVLDELKLPFDEKIVEAVRAQLENKRNDLYIVELAVKILAAFKSKSLLGVFLKFIDIGYLKGFAKEGDGSSDNTASVAGRAADAIDKICDEATARRLLPLLKRELRSYASERKTAIKNARESIASALIRAVGRFLPAEVLPIAMGLEGFDYAKAAIAEFIEPQMIADKLVPSLMKRANRPFEAALLKKKGGAVAKGLVKSFLAEKDTKYLDALAVMQLDAETIAPLVEILPDSDLRMIETIVGKFSKIDGIPAIKAYASILGGDWNALRALGKEAVDPALAMISKRSSSNALSGSANHFFEVLCDVDYERALSAFRDLEPCSFKIYAIDTILEKSPSRDAKEKFADSAISFMIDLLKASSTANNVKSEVASKLKRLFAEGELGEAAKAKIVACNGMVLYRTSLGKSGGHYDDCLTSGPPDTWHTDRVEKDNQYFDMKFEL